jgi:predicted N-acetyltransferase YhbS
VRERAYTIIFVFGEPHYCTRFGFAAEKAAPFACRYAGPQFMALNLTERSIEPTPVVYPRAFHKLE